jgi:hypothetical protein
MSKHRKVLWGVSDRDTSKIIAVSQFIFDLHQFLEHVRWPFPLRRLVRRLCKVAENIEGERGCFDCICWAAQDGRKWHGDVCEFTSCIDELISCVPYLKALHPDLANGLYAEAAIRDVAATWLKKGDAYIDGDGAVVAL